MSTRLEEYEHAQKVQGTIFYNSGWYLLRMPQEFLDQWIDQLEKDGEEVIPSRDPHISITKNEAPATNKDDWGKAFVDDKVKVKYNKAVRSENGYHFWIDCYSPKLCMLREHFGLTTLKTDKGVYMVNFHMTLGRRKTPVKADLRAQYRLWTQSHIDVETRMQHL